MNFKNILITGLSTSLLLLSGLTSTVSHAAAVNLINNPSFENLDSLGNPIGWSRDGWGNNTRNYTIENNGYDGTKSAKVVVTNWIDGDARWGYADVTVKPNTNYNFSLYYKSANGGEIDMKSTNSLGVVSYSYLNYLVPSPTAWSKVSSTFKTGIDTTKLSIFSPVYGNFDMQTDAYSLTELTPASTAFTRGLISIEFDDGWKDAYTTGFPVVESFGFKATNYVITNTTSYADYMTNANIVNLKSRGHTIGSHTVSHPHLPVLSQADITAELTNSKQFLDSLLGVPTRLLATPYCESNVNVINVAKTLYNTLRNCDRTLNAKSTFDKYNINSIIVENTTTLAQIKAWIAEAKANKTWLVLVYHRVRPNIETYSVTKAQLTSHMQAIKTSGVVVKSTDQALDEILPQL